MEARTVSFQRYTRLGKQPRADGEKTREAILDAAEYLFSFGGLDGVSIRQITKAARTDLGSVNYYFGSKKLLFNAVLVRRVARMTEQRLESLSSLALVPGQPESVRAVLFAFIEPLFGRGFVDRDSLANYRRLVALVTNSRALQDEVFRQHYDDAAKKYIDTLSNLVRGAPSARVCWYFNFFLGALTNAIAETGRVDRLSGGACQSHNLNEMVESLLDATVPALMSLEQNKCC